MNNLTLRLIQILGKRVFVSFCVVTFLTGALLSAVNMASRYALKIYVEAQLDRIPWDFTLYKPGRFTSHDHLPEHLRQISGIRQVERLAFLRTILPSEGPASLEVDGKPLGTPWICLLAASDLSLLPPELHLALGSGARSLPNGSAIMVLVGPERAMGKAFLSLQGSRELRMNVTVANTANKEKRLLFQTHLEGVIRLNREELNRWLIDQTGSIAFVPHIGVILLMPYQVDTLQRFDLAAAGLAPPEAAGEPAEGSDDGQKAEYLPEVSYLARADRERLISGWDLPASLERMHSLEYRMRSRAEDGTVVDSTTLVLLERISEIARLIGFVTVLMALPLLWIAWVLAANLSTLLMLNERRTLGLMRLRGVPGWELGRALLWTITAAGMLGGIAGLLTGTLLPLWIYEGGRLPLKVADSPGQILLGLAFLAITVGHALLVSRGLVRYAMEISPLEASGRVAASEAIQTQVHFGEPQFLALLLGTSAIGGWIFGYSLFSPGSLPWARSLDRGLNFVGLPLFLYGLTTFLASRRNWIEKILRPLITPIAGRLGLFASRHLAMKPHRTVAFLLVVALMASVGLYPLVTRDSFLDRTVRGAKIQTGSDWQITFNSPDLVPVERLQGRLQDQVTALRQQSQRLSAILGKVRGVSSTTSMFEALLPAFYLPSYGLRGVPLYLLNDTEEFRNQVYGEPELGVTGTYDSLLDRVKSGELAVSVPVASFWKLSAGSSVLLGPDGDGNAVTAFSGGTLGFLPGSPSRTVNDRQGYVQARVDYLNYLFSENAYLVASADNQRLAGLQVLIPRLIVLVRTEPGVDPDELRGAMIAALPVTPLEMRSVPQEIRKLGSDMFISLAMENLRIFLLGGVLLALVAILSVAAANYAEDRRTLALLRIRGASPVHIWRFLVALLMAPAFLGLLLGSALALVAGFGLANYVWRIRELRTVVQLLPTHLMVSGLMVGIILLLLLLLAGVASLFSLWVFRRTARETIQEG